MVAQRGVAVLIAEPEPHEPDEIGSLHRIARIGRQELREDVTELFAKVH